MDRALTQEEHEAVREARRRWPKEEAYPYEIIIAKLAEQIEWLERHASMDKGREP